MEYQSICQQAASNSPLTERVTRQGTDEAGRNIRYALEGFLRKSCILSPGPLSTRPRLLSSSAAVATVGSNSTDKQSLTQKATERKSTCHMNSCKRVQGRPEFSGTLRCSICRSTLGWKLRFHFCHLLSPYSVRVCILVAVNQAGGFFFQPLSGSGAHAKCRVIAN